MKSSLAVSILVHAAIVAAVLLLGRAVLQERDVFFVELKSITVSPTPKGEPDAPPAEKPKSPPPATIAAPKKKAEPGIKKPQVVEEKPEALPKVSKPAESYAIEYPAFEQTAKGDNESVAYSATDGGAEGVGVSRGVSSGVEGAAVSSGAGVSRDALLLQIRDAIQRELTYPPLARRRRLEGTVVAGFTIDGAGRPHGIEIVESSGFKVLDDEVVKIIGRAAPFPRIPERIEVPVSFKLVTGR